MPAPERKLRRLARWILRSAAGETADPFGTYRLIRLSTVRDFIKARGDAPLLASDGWAANVELLHELRGVARRVESVPLAPRYDLRPRASRRRVFSDALALFRASRTLRRAHARAASA